MSYPELKFGGRKSSSQCLVKSYGPETCSYGFGGSLASVLKLGEFGDFQENHMGRTKLFRRSFTGYGLTNFGFGELG